MFGSFMQVSHTRGQTARLKSPKEHEFLSVVARRQPRGGLKTVMRCQQTPCPEIGSRHRCTPSTARVRLPVSLCHIANSKNTREFNASHNQLRQMKLRTVNSHFATLPVCHRASGLTPVHAGIRGYFDAWPTSASNSGRCQPLPSEGTRCIR